MQLDTAIEGSAVIGNDLSLPPGRYRIDDPGRPETAAVEFEVKEGETKDVGLDR